MAQTTDDNDNDDDEHVGKDTRIITTTMFGIVAGHGN